MNIKIGIYKITNPKGNIYIGQSTNIYERWNVGHKYSHTRKKGVGNKLKNSYKKYGWENHIIEIIEECSIDVLNEREIYWTIYYDSYKTGLNSQIGGFTGYHSDEWKFNQSQNNKGTKRINNQVKKRPEHSKFLKDNPSKCGLRYARTPQHKEHLSQIIVDMWKEKKTEISKKISINKIGKGLKPIICDTLFGMEFESTTEASKMLNISAGNICDVLKGNKIHTHGLYFRYKQPI